MAQGREETLLHTPLSLAELVEHGVIGDAAAGPWGRQQAESVTEAGEICKHRREPWPP